MAPPRKCSCNTCLPCKRREWGRAAYRAKAYGEYDQRFGDLTAVRAHIEALQADGYSVERIAAAAGVTRAHLWRISQGRTGRISRETADQILAAAPIRGSYPAWRARRRLRALAALGWSQRELADRLGLAQRNLLWMLQSAKWVMPDTFHRVDDLYRELCMTPGPSIRAARAAKRRGDAPPLAWNDIDDPSETPRGIRESSAEVVEEVDEVVVERLLSLERVPSTRAEKEAAMEQWLAAGRPAQTLCLAHGWKEGRYGKRKDVAS